VSLPAERRDPDDDAADTAADAATTAEIVRLRAERAELRRRLAEAEQIAEDLAEELGQARARLAAQDGVRPRTDGDARLPLLDHVDESPDGVLRSIDGSDRLVLPIALAATALVVFLVAVLSLANNGFLSLFSIGSLLVSGLLARLAWAMRIVPVEVWVDRGVVLIRRGDNSLSFDLTSDALRLDVHGEPGDRDWRVRFHRRGLEPCDIDASMVDPDAFMEHLRRYRPAS
jgi:hypothetical protein